MSYCPPADVEAMVAVLHPDKLEGLRKISQTCEQFPMQTLIIYKLGFNQNYYTFTLILLIQIVMCSKFP